MENHRWLKIECLHRVGGPEAKRLKVAALNLFHSTASPLFQEVVLFMLRHSLLRGEERVRGSHQTFG
jgi:hypothetical protein